MSQFFYGVIEGFYGRQWSWQIRIDYADFLLKYGFDAYIYAPKGDVRLRSEWRQLHDSECWQQLQHLRQHYQNKGLRWGVGLSPLGLSSGYSSADKQLLSRKLDSLNQLQPDILCILFDDMRGDIDGLAQRQLEIVADIVEQSVAGQYIICPTYYSFDPVLEQVFGKMPADYLQQLGQQLPAEVDVFWTGNKVISESYQQQDIERASVLLGRKPVLWDNYPVNDGKLTSDKLHMHPFQGRPSQLSEWCAGQLVNPMNQPVLSQFVLRSLQAVYQQQSGYNSALAQEQSLKSLQCNDLAAQLRQDIELFQLYGRSALSEQQRQLACQQYRSFGHPLANEVADWLAGEYAFDPGCLTG